LAAAIGASGGRSNAFNSEHTNRPSLMNDYATAMSPNIKSFHGMKKEDFTHIRHLPPFSFGVMARKDLWKNVGIESGLLYTYLSSRFEWEGYNVHQNLHYLGIPVNFVTYLWNSHPNWKLYFSAGFTIEKGLRAIYTQNKQSEAKTTNTIVKTSINGFQWSLNGSLGVNYRFAKGFGIYVEPRFGYSFDCNQPISMRTEWPLFVGFGLGINYEF